ncbi:helix-turn-helix domain-containing protein [Limosilactobacillus reuteri]|uniref:helix-turn-helix domain-containing protein n=1 Tax=Limosilactobacillus reuteri TaxID=1598 RepID=UPI000A320FE0|nr:helix-turn-helix transcriptional regulator [Limosilactobacillus reuteri]MDZ5437671.1 helix-turn-helix transcriptional regulator [Limosilactobacillus reuteri]
MNQEQTNITTGKQIRHLRTQLGMTQEELAGELNVTRQALSNWERDVNEPDLNMWQIARNNLNKSIGAD